MNLKQFLKAESTTPQAFALLVGVSPQALYRYISGDRFPTPENLRRIRDVTNGQVTADDFVDQHTSPAGPAEAA